MSDKYEMQYDDDYLAKNFFELGEDHGLKNLLKEHLDVTVEISNEGFDLEGSNDNVDKAVEILTDLSTVARSRRVIDEASVKKAFHDRLGVEFAENATDIAISEDHATQAQKKRHKPREDQRVVQKGNQKKIDENAFQNRHEPREGQRPARKGNYKKYHDLIRRDYEFNTRTPDQDVLVEALKHNDVVFATGPAGTGKTHVAVAKAAEALKNGEIERIILARPAVPAEEDLGHLPGTAEDKIAPYMRPLYDELDKVIGGENRKKLMDAGIIEIAPVGMLRGRTLEHAHIILDEAQNMTTGQMKMALSRTGEGSKVVVAGDPYQVDLPKGKKSGLEDALEKFAPYADNGVGMVDLKTVMRSKIANLTVKAYGDDQNRPNPARKPQGPGNGR